jgi:geranylgeranyl pyrophosphate synthase
MCAYKTGCLSRMAATAAAIIGDATPTQRKAVAAFAETLGVVFQIQDDLLNIRDSILSRKKGRGEDITEGKRSLAVIHALRMAPRTQRARLLALLDMHTSDQHLRDEAIEIIEKSGGVTRAKRTMERLFQTAWTTFDRTFPDSEAKRDIEQLARFLMERDV